jgi:4-amino-4-deoxy-L-arabinose transferase-like glycosyltransferase
VRVYFFVTLFRITSVQRVWDTGYEACHIAASVATGQGFSSPFGVPTGPTAWVPPLYVSILAIVFKIFGPYTTAAAWTMLLLNALFAALTAMAMYFVGERILGSGVGVIAGWVWALSPYAVTMSIKVWETSLSALLVVAGLLLYERVKESPHWMDWAVWGSFWGCAMLANTVLVIFYPFLSLGAVGRDRRPFRLQIVAAVALSAIVGPWILRNDLQLHSFIPVRGNFGEELWLGNHEGVTGPNDQTRHPLAVPAELAAYRELGERDFVAGKQRAAIAFIAGHSAEFAGLTLRRIAYFWVSPRGSGWLYISALSFVGLGLAMKKDFVRVLPFFIALLFFPIAYYLTHADNWYRHPIEPLMILLIVYTLVRLWHQTAISGTDGAKGAGSAASLT